LIRKEEEAMEILALASFLALIVAWMVTPIRTTG